MAQKIQTLFIDDLDGSAAEGTVRFGLDGTEYEIDLNEEHAKAAARCACALCERRAAGQRRCSPASPNRAPGSGERAEHHRGPRVGQSPGHRGKRPRPGACRAGGQIQGGHRTVRPGHTSHPIDGSDAAAKPATPRAPAVIRMRKSVSAHQRARVPAGASRAPAGGPAAGLGVGRERTARRGPALQQLACAQRTTGTARWPHDQAAPTPRPQVHRCSWARCCPGWPGNPR